MEPYFKLAPYKDSNDLQQIVLYYFNKGQRLKINTGIKTKKFYWADKTQKISSRCSEIEQDSDELNRTLREKKRKLGKIVDDFYNLNNYYPSITYVEQEFKKEGKAKQIEQQKEVKKLFEDWIVVKEDKVKYIKVFRTVLNDLKLFHPKPLYYSDLTTEFFESLRNYWRKLNPPIQNVTILKRLRCFKMFLWTLKDLKNRDFEDYNIDLHGIDRQPIIIPTPEEFEILVKATDLPEHLDDARDLYCIGCSTGLRYSDASRLTINNIDGDFLIEDLTKTETLQHRIPLNDVARHFLNKQFYKFNDRVKDISNQKLNEALTGYVHKKTKMYIGGLFQYLAKHHPDKPFTKMVTYFVKYGTDLSPITCPKSDRLTFHSSRKFFISYLVNVQKIALGDIMELSGHTSGTIDSYIEKGSKQKEAVEKAFRM